MTYHVERNNLAIGFLYLLELGKEVPETRLGDDGIRCEYAHTVKLWGRCGIGREMAANDLVLLKATCEGAPLVSIPRMSGSRKSASHDSRVCARHGKSKNVSVFHSRAHRDFSFLQVASFILLLL